MTVQKAFGVAPEQFGVYSAVNFYYFILAVAARENALGARGLVVDGEESQLIAERAQKLGRDRRILAAADRDYLNPR